MTDCPDCAAAATQAWAGFKSGCDGCTARAVGRSLVCWNARHALPQDDDYHQARQRYRDMLEAAGVSHDQVVRAMRNDWQEVRR